MVALSGAAPQGVFDLIERHQIQAEAHRGGTLRAAATTAQACARCTGAAAASRAALGAPGGVAGRGRDGAADRLPPLPGRHRSTGAAAA